MSLRNMYLGTYQNNRRSVVTVAPDAVIFINGKRVANVCAACNTKFEIDSHATGIQTSLSLDGAGSGSASVTLQIPRSSGFPFVQDGRPFIANMSEIEIYFKGYYLVNGLPRYYPAFWGIVTNITSSYSGGVHSFSLSCKDILHWWSITQYTFSPALISTHLDSRNIPQVYKNRFANLTPIQILVGLARETFDEGLVPAIQGLLTNSPLAETTPVDVQLNNKFLVAHWQRRHKQVMRAMRFFGADGGLVFEGASFVKNSCNSKAEEDRAFGQIQTLPTITGTSLDLGLNLATDFNPFSELPTGGIQLFEGDSSTKLEIAVAVKDWIGFEFFLDTTGEIVFKPPFYNIDVRPNFPVSWIRDQEILSWNFTEEEPEYTRIEVRGGINRLLEQGPETAPTAYHTDYILARQYGLRQGTLQRNWIRTPTAAYLHAVTELDRVTTRRFTATVDIIGRPELRLGYPIYIESLDTFWYVTDISHGFSYGGQFTTTLGLTARRPKFVDSAYRLVASKDQTIDENGVARDSEGRNEGIRNAVLRLNRNPTAVEAAPETQKQGAITEDATGTAVATPAKPDAQNYTQPTAGKKGVERGSSDRAHGRLVDLPSGLYEPDTNSAVKGVVIKYPSKDGEITVLGSRDTTNTVIGGAGGTPEAIATQIEKVRSGFQGISETEKTELGNTKTLAALPVSDSNGYEVIGAFPYGRQFKLNENGALSREDDSNQESREFVLISPQATDESVPNDFNTRVSANDAGNTAGVFQVDQTQTGLVFQELQPERRTNLGCLCKTKLQEFDLEFIKSVFSNLSEENQSQSSQEIVTQSTIPQISIVDQQARDIALQTDVNVVSPTAADIGFGGGRGDE